MDELNEIISELEGLLPRFKQSSMEGLYLKSEDQARFRGLIFRAKDVFDENLGGGNFYTNNLITTVNHGSGGAFGGPSFNSVQTVIELLKAGVRKIGKVKSVEAVVEREHKSALANVVHICRQFHGVARSIKNRHDGRETVLIKDEYDVQDLLRALLVVDYADIREEEGTPSSMGASSRIDFVLKNEKIVIEVKMARKGLTDKKLGEELAIDIARYKGHPDCKMMVCFIYDPEELIRNKNGLAADLEKQSTEEMPIFAVIVP